MCHFASAATLKSLKDLVLIYKVPMKKDNCSGLFSVDVLVSTESSESLCTSKVEHRYEEVALYVVKV